VKTNYNISLLYMRYFELINNKSAKFWEIHDYWNANRKYVEVRYGKINTDGRTVKHFYNGPAKNGAGTKMVDKLVASKLKKGYKEKKNPTIIKKTIKRKVRKHNSKKRKLKGGNFLPKCSNQHVDISNHHPIRNYLDYYPPMTGGSFLPKCSNQHVDISNHHPIRNYLDYYPPMTGGSTNPPLHPGIGEFQNINNSDMINLDNYARVNSINTNNVIAKIVGGSLKKTKRNKRN
jgi:predicted DNA-binding WGR domain protein